MKTGLFLLLWFGIAPVSLAQSGDESLAEIDMTLFLNHRTSHIFMGANAKQSMAILDTMAVTAEVLQQRAMFERDIAKAVAMLEKSTELDPKMHNTVGWSFLFAYRDYPRALRHLEAYDALTPDFDDTDVMSPVSYLKGLCYRGMGNHAEAIRQFSKGIDSLAQKQGAEWVNYKHYITRAISYLALNQPDKALADLDLAIKNSTSDSPLALYYKGKAFLQQGRTTDARRTFQDAQFFWQANRVKGISQPEDDTNLVMEEDIDEALKQ
jgi:tetratricopeptide (TPR) repeat protein